ncbi:hypothetical protein SAMN03097699_1609 [Flavobacteriaceae bacterium MAR_2010_188]|nr:hypothetical protein SAMN03097699_1609 [Flavobacteriaceae bacterium MAR_2010_188]
MISVLIPIYNQNVLELVNGVIIQFERLDVEYEIICIEDGSDSVHLIENSSLKNLKKVTYLITEKNKGRIKSRQKLSALAKFPWLLFLDADVKLKKEDFIQDYLKAITTHFEVVFGGFVYYKEPPDNSHLLRWKYGRQKEEVAAFERNKRPYKIVISANYLIKKSVFENIYGKIEYTGYGYDNFFGALLKENHIKVLHIDNEVYHLGIEESSVYLNKKEKAAEALVNLYLSGHINNHENNLLELFVSLKSKGLNKTFKMLFLNFRDGIKKNLLGRNPSIKLLQFYRIGYMCYYESLKN